MLRVLLFLAALFASIIESAHHEDPHRLLANEVNLTNSSSLQRTQSIVDRLNKTTRLSALYILENENVTSLNGIAFNNDNITRLSLDGNGSGRMNIKSLNGIKRWPKYLHEFGIFNMMDFDINSLSEIPDSVTIIRCANVVFDSLTNASISRINLPQNLVVLNIQHCTASRAQITALNIAHLSHLSELHLIYFDRMRCLDQRCFIYFPFNLQYLCIDYALIESVIQNQKQQKMKKLKYVWVKHIDCKNNKKCKELKERITEHFDNPKLYVAGDSIL